MGVHDQDGNAPDIILDGSERSTILFFLTQLKEGLESLPHLSLTVTKRTDEEGKLQAIAMKMSGEILCSMNLSSTTTVSDFRTAV